MRIPEKANSTKVVQCGCGRMALTLLNDNDEVIASCEYDPEQWFRICKEIIEKNMELVDNGFEPPPEDLHIPS